MNEDLNEFIRQTSDGFLFEMLLTIFKRIFPEDSIFIPLLTLSRKHGMPVKNIMAFIEDLGEWCSEHQTTSVDDAKAFQELMQRSGFMTIGFNQEGDEPDGDGRDGT